MAVYKIGTILKQVRKEKKISQLDMCRGLCSLSMASYIENEERVPHRKLIELLFSRLGEPLPVEKVPMTKGDFYRYNLEQKINGMVALGNAEINGLLDEYVACKKGMTQLEKQFFQFYTSFYENRKLDKNEEMLSRLVDALRLTIKNYNLNEFPEQLLFSRQEIFILNNIARCQYSLNKKLEAISLMTQLKKYIEKPLISKSDFAISMPMILFNLSNWSSLEGKDNEALIFAEQGIDICVRYGKLNYFPFHLFNKGFFLAALNKKTEGKKFIENSFLLFDALGRHSKVEYACPIVNEKFGLDILL